MTGAVAKGFTGALPDGNAPFTAWAANAAPAKYKGIYNIALDLDAAAVGDDTVPQGVGYAVVNVASTGAYTITGALGDTTALSGSGFIGSAGQCLIYQSLYSNTGTAMGTAKVVLGTPTTYDDNQVQPGAVDITWSKAPDATVGGARNYPAGWSPVKLVASGSKYPVPGTGQLIMEMGNSPPGVVTVGISGRGVPKNLLTFTVDLKGVSALYFGTSAPFDSVSFSVTPLTGAFKGGFNLSPTQDNPRQTKQVATYAGLIVRTFTGSTASYRGTGNFLLAQLPDVNVSPLPTADSTPKLAGTVEVAISK